jgi:hypothetical protein
VLSAADLKAIARARLADAGALFAAGRLDGSAFLREDAPDVWDLVVAAKWIEEDRPAALADISRRVRDSLRADEITKISRVVVVERTDPALKALASAVSTEHAIAEVANSTFFGLSIRHAFLIAVELNPPPNKVLQPTVAAGGRR